MGSFDRFDLFPKLKDRKRKDFMKKTFISTVIFLVTLSFSAVYSEAQSLDASFFLRSPAEVAQDLFQKMISMKPDDGDYILKAGWHS